MNTKIGVIMVGFLGFILVIGGCGSNHLNSIDLSTVSHTNKQGMIYRSPRVEHLRVSLRDLERQEWIAEPIFDFLPFHFSPRSGSSLGGTLITLSGNHFVNGINVFVAGAPCEVISVTSRKIICRSSARPEGSGPIWIEHPDQRRRYRAPHFYTYGGLTGNSLEKSFGDLKEIGEQPSESVSDNGDDFLDETPPRESEESIEFTEISLSDTPHASDCNLSASQKICALDST